MDVQWMLVAQGSRLRENGFLDIAVDEGDRDAQDSLGQPPR